MNFPPNVHPLKLVRTRANSNAGLGERGPHYGTAPIHMSFSHQEEDVMYAHSLGKQTMPSGLQQKLAKQTQQLLQENETLKSRIDVLSSSIAHLNERIRRKDEEYNRTMGSLEQRSSECYELKEQADQLARKNKSYKRQQKESESESKEVRQQLRVERQLRVQLQAEKNSLLEKLQSLRQSGQALTQDAIDQQMGRVAAEHQQKIERLNELNTTLNSKLQKTEKQLQEVKAQLRESSEREVMAISQLQDDYKKAHERVMQLQESVKLNERDREEWQQERAALKQTEALYNDFTIKYDKLEGKYEDLMERYNEVVGRQKSVEGQLRETKSRLRETEEERDHFRHQYEILLDRDHVIEQHPSRQSLYAGNAASSSFLDEDKSSNGDHKAYQNSSLSINNFASINLPSAHSKKPLCTNNNNLNNTKSNQALGRLIHDSSKERVAAVRSQSEDDNILMTEQYIPTGEQTDSRIQQSGTRKVGGIRSRNRSNINSARRQDENLSPVSSSVPIYKAEQKRQPRHSQLSKIVSDQRPSSTDKGDSFHQLLTRFQQLKSRSRERVL